MGFRCPVLQWESPQSYEERLTLEGIAAAPVPTEREATAEVQKWFGAGVVFSQSG